MATASAYGFWGSAVKILAWKKICSGGVSWAGSKRGEERRNAVIARKA
jgi:hypothetical protein